MSKHTPGPWRLFNENGTVAVMAGKRPTHNEVVHWTGFDASHFPRQTVANGRLIAAAPEMYAALKLAAKEFSRGRIERSLQDAVNAAIAKAEGRDP